MRCIVCTVVLGIVLSGGVEAVAQPGSSCAVGDVPPSRVDSIREAAGVPGLSVAVLHEGAPCEAVASGVVNTQTQRPVTTTSVFEAASLTKPVVAYLVLRQVAEGRLDLDAPVADVLPVLRSRTPHADQVTLRHLLTHTPGVATGDDTTTVRPGTRFSYSSRNYRWAQAVLEKATGQPLGAHARDALFQPQGMMHSRFVWSSTADVGMMGHDGTEPRRPIRHAETPDGAAGLVTTAEDYARFVGAALRGDGLTPTLRDAFIAPQTTVDGWRARSHTASITEALRWGLGWGLERVAMEGTTDASLRVWHWGDNGHFESFVYADPKTRRGLVVLTNGTRGLRAVRPLIQAYFPADGRVRALDWLDVAPADGPDVMEALQQAQTTADVRRVLRSSADEARPFHPERAGPVVDALAARGASDEAVLLGRRIVLEYPQAWRSHLLLAEAYRASGAPRRAREHLYWSLAFGADSTLIQPRLRWLDADVRGGVCTSRAETADACREASTARPVASYTGTYEAVTIRARGDTLTWATRGRPETPLVRTGPHTFRPEGDASVRLSFDVDAGDVDAGDVDAGDVDGVTVRYYGGGVVRYDRTGPTHDAPSRGSD